MHLAKLRAALPAAAVLLVAGLLAPGCDGAAEQDQFADEASAPSAGFTQTTGSGDVVQADADDWRQAPFYAGQFYVSGPAFPNPATLADGVVTLNVQVSFDDVFQGGLRVSARPPADAPCYRDNRTCFISNIQLKPEASRAGGHSFQLPMTDLRRHGPGLVRVLVLTASGEIVSYGDVLVQ